MKYLKLSTVLGVAAGLTSVFGSQRANAQSAGTEVMIINDNNGHLVRLMAPHPLPAYNLNPVITLGIPPAGNPPAGFMNVGGLNNLARWDGISWVTSGLMLNNNTTTAIGTTIDPNVRLTIQGTASKDPIDVTNSSGSPVLYVMTGGNVGVGTSSPASNLSVSGGATVGSSYTGAVSPSNGLAVQGSWGIGTNSPASQLGVSAGVAVGSSYANLNAGNGLIASGNVTIGTSTVDNSAQLTVNGGTSQAAKFYSHDNTVLRVKNTAASGTSLSSSHSFMQFYDGNGTGRGKIQGENGADYASSPEFILSTAVLVFDAAGAAADVAETIATLGIRELLGNLAKTACEIAEYTSEKLQYGLKLGVSYASGSADYAEYLPLLDPADAIYPGDVVGVFNGRISRKTEGADNVMSISFNPGIVGNMPQAGDEKLFRKVAFMGQVPVKVVGPVIEGDYIVPSGDDNGIAVAVRPTNMTASLYTKKVGRSWQTSDNAGVKYVNVAVGLNNEDMQQVVTTREAQIASLKTQVAQLKQRNEVLLTLKSKLSEIKQTMGTPENATGVTPVRLAK